MVRALITAAACLACAMPAGSAAATDLFLTDPNTYYETLLRGQPAEAFASRAPELPPRLAVFDDEAVRVVYARADAGDGAAWEWELRIDGYRHKHERVPAVYQIVMALPLPAGADGGDAFEPLGWGLRPQLGPEPNAPPLVYGGEAVVYKRNVTLERMWLPLLVGVDSGHLPPLDGTGYGWTLWDTVALYDPGHGPEIKGAVRFSYRTAPETPAPDAADPRMSVYLITWIPALDASLPPLAVRARVSQAAAD